MIVVGNKKYTEEQARKLMSNILDRKESCLSKLEKLELRKNVLEQFIEENRGTEITLGDWLKSKGVNIDKMFASLGYYTTINQAVSNDIENEFLSYHKGMIFNPEIQGFVPDPEFVSGADHKNMIKSNLGMTFNPNLQLYFPTTIYDTELFSSAIGNGDDIIDIVGFFNTQDLGNFTAINQDSEEVMQLVKELYEEEYDNVEEEYDIVTEIEDEFNSNFSNAEGDSRPARNVTCRSACGVRYPFNKTKREKCQNDCDTKFPPSEKQDERRDNRDVRRTARQDFRGSRKDCREQFNSGEITRKEFRACKKEEREERKKIVKEAGGNFFTRVGRNFAKVMPVTATMRGATLFSISQLNLFGFATRLYPAFASGTELQKYKPESVVATREAWVRISKAWKNLGGDPDKLKQAIVNGRNKKIHKEPTSEFLGMSTGALVGMAVSIMIALIQLLNTVLKNKGASKDPFKSGQAPKDFKDELDSGALDVQPDPNDPFIDPETGNWIDPETGKKIDPKTGRFEDEIFGMNKYLFYGLATASIIGGILLIRKLVKK